MIVYKPSFISNSLIASLVLVTPVILLFIYVATNDSIPFVDGSVDSDPVRTSWVLFFISLFIYLTLVAFYYISARILFLYEKLSFMNHEVLILITASIFSYLLGHYSWIFFILFFLLLSIWFSSGIAVWHFLENKRYNKFKNKNSSKAFMDAQ